MRARDLVSGESTKATLCAALAALLVLFAATPAHAAKPRYLPPLTMPVSCNPVSEVDAPPRTGYVQYHYFKADPYFDYGLYLTPQQPGLAYSSFESGPGYESPKFPAVLQKGGPLYNTDSSAVMVMAVAYTSERATRILAYGFNTCFGRSPIPIVFTYDGALHRYFNGVLTRL